MPLSIKPPHRPSPKSQCPSESASPPSIESFLAGREHTPEAPPVSPLSPVLEAATLSTCSSGNPDVSTGTSQPSTHKLTPQGASQNDRTGTLSEAQLIDRPPPLPFSAEDSMDAIALRAAISSLQFQRVRAQQDLRTLQEIKTQAVERPEEFRQYIIESASKSASGRQSGPKWSPPPDDDDDMDSEDDAAVGAEGTEEQHRGHRNNIHVGEVPDSQHASFSSTLASQPNPSQERNTQMSPFPTIPMPQEVVRCPPIEWAKYHIHGESLDKLHKEQQMRPGVGGLHGPEHVIAAPYNPFVDVLEERPVRRADARKDSGASATGQPAQRRRSSKASPATK